MLLKLIREGLGRIIIAIDWLTRPRKIQRDTSVQAQVNRDAAGLSLYQFYACPFCVKVRRAIHQLNIPVQYRDAQHAGEYRDELATEGGKIKVPCLRIDDGESVEWLYESKEIIHYLQQRFAD